MILPINVYSALNGMQWLTALHSTLPNREQVRRTLGALPDFNMGGSGYCGVFVEEGMCYIYACFRATKFDSVGRDAVYFVFTYLPQVLAKQLDIDAVLHSAVFTLPRKIWPEPAEEEFKELSIVEQTIPLAEDLRMESFTGEVDIKERSAVWRLVDNVPPGGKLRLQIDDLFPSRITVSYTAPKQRIKSTLSEAKVYGIENKKKDAGILASGLYAAEEVSRKTSLELQDAQNHILTLEHKNTMLQKQLNEAKVEIKNLKKRWENIKYALYGGVVLGVIILLLYWLSILIAQITDKSVSPSGINKSEAPSPISQATTPMTENAEVTNE